jgi:hypothetical protein
VAEVDQLTLAQAKVFTKTARKEIKDPLKTREMLEVAGEVQQI